MADPIKEVWDHLKKYCSKYDAAVFSASKFARAMPIDEFIIAPSIDPLSDKNRDLSEDEIRETIERLQIPLDRPIILQVSRFDRFKDSIGVIKAYRVAKKYNDCILILAGSAAADDPEGELVLSEVKELAADDPDIHVLLLPPFSDKDINALQRIATVVAPEIPEGGLRSYRLRSDVEGQGCYRWRYRRHPAPDNPWRQWVPGFIGGRRSLQDTATPQ